MRKRIVLGAVAAIGATLAMLPLLVAFEAHIINVTASISNAIEANTYSIDFGTVFPQESFEKTFNIALSESFIGDDGFDDVEYVLRQKPKCQLNETGQQVLPALPPFGQVEEDLDGNFICQDETNYDLMPFLCPYLSKSEITEDGIPVENDMGDVEGEPEHLGPLSSFHGPILLAPPPGGWDMTDTLAFQLQGRMAKSDQDFSDTWNIDLKVPCFNEHCAQDWQTFFLANGGTQNGHTAADAEDYVQPLENEHLVYGCDLWVEVTELSTPPGQGTIIINKLVINDDGGTTATSSFQYQINAGVAQNFDADGTNGEPVDPGIYSVTEPAVPGYSTTYSNSENANADCNNLDVAAGEFVTCNIVNNDQEATLIIQKIVINDDEGTLNADNFSYEVDGGAATPFPDDGGSVLTSEVQIAVVSGTYDVTEPAVNGYTPSYQVNGNPAANCNDINVPSGGSATCTITNDDNEPEISCEATIDLMLVLDRSGSINSTELQTLKTAAHAFIDALSPSTSGVHTGQSSFSTAATLDQILTGDEAVAHLAINAINSGGSTDLEAGITLAINELASGNDRTPDADGNFPDFIVVISDGAPNIPDETQGAIDASNAADAARAAGIEVFVVGVGVTPATETYLETEIADDSAHYFSAADFDDLEAQLQLLVACDATQQTLTYAGVSESNDEVNGRPIAFEHDSDVFPWTTSGDINNGTSSPSSSEYTAIQTDNDTRWTSLDPGSGDFIAKRFRFFASTTPVANIDDIKITWKGQPNGDANVSMWIHKAGTSDFVAANWAQLGIAEPMTDDDDEYIVRHLTSDFATYVGAGGIFEVVLTSDNDSESLRTDYIQLLITSNP